MKEESPLHALFGRVRAQWGVFHSDVRSACERSQVPLLLLQRRALHWACSNTARWHGNNRNTRLSKRTSEQHLPSLSPPPAIPRGHSMFLSLYFFFFFLPWVKPLKVCTWEHVYHILHIQSYNKLMWKSWLVLYTGGSLSVCMSILVTSYANLFFLSEELSFLAIFQSF